MHNPQQGLGLHGHLHLDHIFNARLVGIGQQGFRFRRYVTTLVDVLGNHVYF